MKRQPLRWLCSAALLVNAALCFAGDPPATEQPIALIDGKPVYTIELTEASQGQLLNLRKQEYEVKRRALDSLLDKKLLEAEAARRGISVTALTKEIEKVAERFASPADRSRVG